MKEPRHSIETEVSDEVLVEWKGQEGDSTRDVNLALGEARYELVLVNGMFYGGMIEIPEGQRRGGVATKILQKAVEVARQAGVRLIIHHAQSIEGLKLIVSRLKIGDRTYYDNDNKAVDYDEAVRILEKKRADGRDDDKSIFVSTSTDVTKLAE